MNSVGGKETILIREMDYLVIIITMCTWLVSGKYYSLIRSREYIVLRSTQSSMNL